MTGTPMLPLMELIFASVAKGFDFRSPRLGVVDFPETFVQDYVAEMRSGPDRLQTGVGYAVAEFADGPVLCDPVMLLAPHYIFSINKILDESMYAPKGGVRPLGRTGWK